MLSVVETFGLAQGAAALKGNGHPKVATVTDLLTELMLVRLVIYA